ncbi:uncharacterized protein L3040_005729 [Drepanopeziza brunnea f. sp. 'multigermtubi']|uniref:uncharacterized protein n=1 Tax=Drepanopeziza brunnea f. sp. 'multigermtubi' TaxID=698441 RepID=UPI0023A0F58C|nr:hypothetical protein L3040_005729 [Drepanopeziza brunnea f. sp. 'multigermtubi']
MLVSYLLGGLVLNLNSRPKESCALERLSKINIITNPKYQKDGLKSYAYLLNEWGFNPTQPGPYVQIAGPSNSGHQGLLSKLGKNSARLLVKKVGVSRDGSSVITEFVPVRDQQNENLYHCTVSIGTPPQTLVLHFDTASADSWVWSTELSKNMQSAAKCNGHELFDSTKSSTFTKMRGSTWKITHGDHSAVSGIVGTDTVVLGGLEVTGQAIELAKSLSERVAPGVGDGILGLAFRSINTVTPKAVSTPVENMITQPDIPKGAELCTAKIGSWCDADEPDDEGAGFYTFGYIDLPTVEASGQDIYYTPVDSSDGFWTVSSGSTIVNDTVVTKGGKTAIIDTGSPLTLVSDVVCQAIYGSIEGAVYDPQDQGWVFPSITTLDQLPTVSVAIGDKQFTINKEDLGFATTSNSTIYSSIQSRGDMDFDILGHAFLKGVYAIFDQGNRRFGAVERPQEYQDMGFVLA